MKLNKKVLAGALALAMGLSAIAPAYAEQPQVQAQESTAKAKTQDYEQKKQAFIEEVKKASELKKSLEQKGKDLEEKERKYNDLIGDVEKDLAIIALYNSLKDYDDAVEKKPNRAESFKENLETVKYQIKNTLGENAEVKHFIDLVDSYVLTKKGKEEIEKLYETSNNKAEIAEIDKLAEERDNLKEEIRKAKEYTKEEAYTRAKEEFLTAGAEESEVSEIEKSEGEVSSPAPSPAPSLPEDSSQQTPGKQEDTKEQAKKKLEDAYKKNKDTIKEQEPKLLIQRIQQKFETLEATINNKGLADEQTYKEKVEESKRKLIEVLEEVSKSGYADSTELMSYLETFNKLATGQGNAEEIKQELKAKADNAQQSYEVSELDQATNDIKDAEEAFKKVGGSDEEIKAIKEEIMGKKTTIPQPQVPSTDTEKKDVPSPQAPTDDTEEDKQDEQSPSPQTPQQPQAPSDDTETGKQDTPAPQAPKTDTQSKENTNSSPKVNTDVKKENIDEQIKKAVTKLKRKLDALKFIKENFEETYKRNAEVIDKALEEGTKVLQLVEKNK